MLDVFDRLKTALPRNCIHLLNTARYDFKGYSLRFKLYKNFVVKAKIGFGIIPVAYAPALPTGWSIIKWGEQPWGA